MKPAALAVLLTCALQSVEAAPTGNEWKAMCDAPDSDDRHICLMTTVSVLEGLSAGYALRDQLLTRELLHKELGREPTWDEIKSRMNSSLYCAPTGVNNGQLKDIIYKHINEHPETRHQPITLLTLKAVTTAFPCP
jgi:hypothetical protein